MSTAAQLQTETDCTVYNKYLVGRVETWQRVEITSVHWEQRHAVRGDLNSPDVALVFIPFARGANYLKPRIWQASSKTGFWTLQIGDVIVKGLVSSSLVTGAFTLSDLKAAYDDVLVIASVDTRDFGSGNLQHWEVTAR